VLGDSVHGDGGSEDTGRSQEDLKELKEERSKGVVSLAFKRAFGQRATYPVTPTEDFSTCPATHDESDISDRVTTRVGRSELTQDVVSVSRDESKDEEDEQSRLKKK
jgi:hypothetical protein